MEVKEDDFHNPRRITFILNMSYLDKKKEYSISDIERFLGYHGHGGQPDIRKLTQLLIDKNIFVLSKEVFKVKLYKVDIKKLKSFIEELECAKEWSKYFYQHKILLESPI